MLAACTAPARLPPTASEGADPVLPEPAVERLPTVHIAPARGWPPGLVPVAAEGLTVRPFAKDLDHPRWLHLLPNGDVLVAETNAPARSGEHGLKHFIMKKVQARAGAGMASPNRISLLRDADRDGVAEQRNVFLSGLNSPFGMAVIGDVLYIANTDAVVRTPYRPGSLSVGQPVHVVDLPAGPINHHWTKDLIATDDGRALYATVGSNSNAGENGLAAEDGRAAIWVIDPIARTQQIHASGLRNPNGLAWEPRTGDLWVAVNERDELGSDLVPDYITSVQRGAFYGWPYSWFGAHVDPRVKPRRPDLVARSVRPDYAVGTHTGSLGFAFNDAQRGLRSLGEGAFVGQHGSWNRRPASGYRVIFIPFVDGRPRGRPRVILSGFLAPDGGAYGRPVGVALDGRGGLLVADDVGNTVWRVSEPAPR